MAPDIATGAAELDHHDEQSEEEMAEQDDEVKVGEEQAREQEMNDDMDDPHHHRQHHHHQEDEEEDTEPFVPASGSSRSCEPIPGPFPAAWQMEVEDEEDVRKDPSEAVSGESAGADAQLQPPPAAG